MIAGDVALLMVSCIAKSFPFQVSVAFVRVLTVATAYNSYANSRNMQTTTTIKKVCVELVQGNKWKELPCKTSISQIDNCVKSFESKALFRKWATAHEPSMTKHDD